jgi:predicted amidohydrolase
MKTDAIGSQFSMDDFLAKRQIQRKEYFESTRPSVQSSQDKVEISEAATQASTRQADAANSTNAAAQSTKTSSTDSASQLQKTYARQYGSFYATSPNGRRLAELRAQSDAVIAKVQEKEQQQVQQEAPLKKEEEMQSRVREEQADLGEGKV